MGGLQSKGWGFGGCDETEREGFEERDIRCQTERESARSTFFSSHPLVNSGGICDKRAIALPCMHSMGRAEKYSGWLHLIEGGLPRKVRTDVGNAVPFESDGIVLFDDDGDGEIWEEPCMILYASTTKLET